MKNINKLILSVLSIVSLYPGQARGMLRRFTAPRAATATVLGTGGVLGVNNNVPMAAPVAYTQTMKHSQNSDQNAAKDRCQSILEYLRDSRCPVANKCDSRGKEIKRQDQEQEHVPLGKTPKKNTEAQKTTLSSIASSISLGNEELLNMRLRLAASQGKIEVVKFLIDKGATDFDGALREAAESTDIVELLINKGVTDLDAILRKAAGFGKLYIVKDLLDKGATDLDGALRQAAESGQVNIVELLINKGAADADRFFLNKAKENTKKKVRQGIKKVCFWGILLMGWLLSPFLFDIVDKIEYLEKKHYEKIDDELITFIERLSDLQDGNPTATQELLGNICTRKNSRRSVNCLLNICNKNDKADGKQFDRVRAMVSKVVEIERVMEPKGYTVFVHGRNWEWNFLNDVWNLIGAVKNNQKTMSDKISLRQREVDCDLQQLYKFRQELIDRGVDDLVSSATDHTGKNNEVTFMVRSPVSNIDIWTESSGRYFLQDHSCGGEKKGHAFALALLSKYGLEQYEDQVKELAKLHEQSSKSDNLSIKVISSSSIFS